MTTLVAIGFLDETAAPAAARYLRRLTRDILLDADTVAVVSRDDFGVVHVTTSHQATVLGCVRGVFWLPLLSALCFVPLFGPAAGTGEPGYPGAFRLPATVVPLRDQVLDMLQPGTSVLFLVTGPTMPATAVADIEDRFAGTAVTAPLPAATGHRLLGDPNRAARRSEATGRDLPSLAG